jgi:hypothetical protein
MCYSLRNLVRSDELTTDGNADDLTQSQTKTAATTTTTQCQRRSSSKALLYSNIRFMERQQPISDIKGNGSSSSATIDASCVIAQQFVSSFLSELGSPIHMCAMLMRLYSPFISPLEAHLCGSDSSEPLITLKQFLLRILTSFHELSPSVSIIAVLLVARLLSKNSQLHVTNLNQFRLIFVAIIIAAKINEDQTYSNADYASISGYLPLDELNGLERQFLFFIDFDLHVTTTQLACFILKELNRPSSPQSESTTEQLHLISG